MMSEGSGLSKECDELRKSLRAANDSADVQGEEAKRLQGLLDQMAEAYRVRGRQITTLSTNVQQLLNQGLRNYTTTGQQTDGDTRANVPAPTLKRKEQVKIRKAFKEKFAGVDAMMLSDIVVDNCEKFRDAPANAAIVIDDLPIHVQYLLLGYIRRAKGETEDETEDEAGPETET
jgi:hypothetical protein